MQFNRRRSPVLPFLLAALSLPLTTRADDFSDAVQQGDAAAAAQHYDQAVEQYTLALHLNPGNPDLLKKRGTAHLRNDQLDEALADFSQGAGLAPKDPDFPYNAAQVHARRHEFI